MLIISFRFLQPYSCFILSHSEHELIVSFRFLYPIASMLWKPWDTTVFLANYWIGSNTHFITCWINSVIFYSKVRIDIRTEPLVEKVNYKWNQQYTKSDVCLGTLWNEVQQDARLKLTLNCLFAHGRKKFKAQAEIIEENWLVGSDIYSQPQSKI